MEIKIHIEERLMLGEFPDEYPRYRHRVPKLVPGLRLISGRRVASSGRPRLKMRRDDDEHHPQERGGQKDHDYGDDAHQDIVLA
jgi:hypothetical protein